MSCSDFWCAPPEYVDEEFELLRGSGDVSKWEEMLRPTQQKNLEEYRAERVGEVAMWDLDQSAFKRARRQEGDIDGRLIMPTLISHGHWWHSEEQRRGVVVGAWFCIHSGSVSRLSSSGALAKNAVIWADLTIGIEVNGGKRVAPPFDGQLDDVAVGFSGANGSEDPSPSDSEQAKREAVVLFLFGREFRYKPRAE
eukprot:6462146-Amphidinium_carterae.6